jgi:hypothetical protein
MIEREHDKPNTTRPTSSADEEENLTYSVEVWESGNANSVERVLARAFNLTLARAIFVAARDEHPGRRITLRHGTRIIADSSK